MDPTQSPDPFAAPMAQISGFAKEEGASSPAIGHATGEEIAVG